MVSCPLKIVSVGRLASSNSSSIVGPSVAGYLQCIVDYVSIGFASVRSVVSY